MRKSARWWIYNDNTPLPGIPGLEPDAEELDLEEELLGIPGLEPEEEELLGIPLLPLEFTICCCIRAASSADIDPDLDPPLDCMDPEINVF